MNEKISAIILANNKEKHHYELTKTTIETLRNSTKGFDLQIIIIESNPNAENIFDECKIIKPDIPFNYGDYVNLGYTYSDGDWIFILNNDLEFTENWWIEILKQYGKDNSIQSFSPFEPNFHGTYYGAWFNSPDNIYFGYDVSGRITGWCMIHRREILNKIGLFDPRFKFFFIDDDYSRRLQYNNIKHAIVKSSIVYHKTSKSHDTIPDLITQNAMDEAKRIFEEKWKFFGTNLRPRIKFIHLLLDPKQPKDIPQDMWKSRISKQRLSINYWRQVADIFFSYNEIYSEVNREELPVETCADPSIINPSKAFENNPPVLSYGHYGAYKAHRNAILNEFNPEVDALLIVEGDVISKLHPRNLVDEILDAVKFSFCNNVSLFTFGKVSYGTGSLASMLDTTLDFDKYKKIDHFLCAQCYLVLQNERVSIQDKLLNTGWHAWDIWLYWNYDRRVPIFCTKEPLVHEPEGSSMIDYKNKET